MKVNASSLTRFPSSRLTPQVDNLNSKMSPQAASLAADNHSPSDKAAIQSAADALKNAAQAVHKAVEDGKPAQDEADKGRRVHLIAILLM